MRHQSPAAHYHRPCITKSPPAQSACEQAHKPQQNELQTQLGLKSLSTQSWSWWACFLRRSIAALASERHLQHLLPRNGAWPMPPHTIIPRHVYTSVEAKACPEGGVMRSAPRQRPLAASRADTAMTTVLPGATPRTHQPPRNRFTWREPATSGAGPSHPSPRPYNVPHATADRSRWHEAIGHTATTPCAYAQACGR